MNRPICLVTGATNGIGLATAELLASRGCELILTGRDDDRLAATRSRLTQAAPGAAITTLRADFASLDEVAALADAVLQAWPRLDALINNAGLLTDHRQTSLDGFELTFAVNHLAPLLLTRRLLPLLLASAPARIAFNSSSAMGSAQLDLDDLQMTRRFDGWTAYANTKLANMLMSNLLARELAGTGVVSNAFCPGLVDTGLLNGNRDFGPAMMAGLRRRMRPPEQGAVTPVFLATDPAAAHLSGHFFLQSHGGGRQPLNIAWDEQLAESLRAKSLALLEPWLGVRGAEPGV
jgi:NAD(P)-dependent dehydrogenase (short-subunit alcohol dehydrogenase family)